MQSTQLSTKTEAAQFLHVVVSHKQNSSYQNHERSSNQIIVLDQLHQKRSFETIASSVVELLANLINQSMKSGFSPPNIIGKIYVFL